MNRRLGLAIIAVLALTVTGGCLNYINDGGEPDATTLDAAPEEPYDWNSSRNATLTLDTGDELRAVYNVSADQELRLYQPTSPGQEGPLDISAVRFRYDNGTVINGTELETRGPIEKTPDEMFVTAPADGSLAFTAGATPRRLTLPVYVEGSYEVILPPGSRMDFFLFSNAVPPGGEIELLDNRDRVHVTWEDVSTGSITVQYYQQQDLTIFAVAVALLSVIAVGGLYYYRRQIDRLHAVRVEMGLDEDDEEER